MISYLNIVLPNTNPTLRKLCAQRRVSVSLINTISNSFNMNSENGNSSLHNSVPANSSLSVNQNDLTGSKQIEWPLARIFDKEINFLRKIELLKEDLCQIESFSPLEAYKLMYDERFGGITATK